VGARVNLIQTYRIANSDWEASNNVHWAKYYG
jgi:hypothetical protein